MRIRPAPMVIENMPGAGRNELRGRSRDRPDDLTLLLSGPEPQASLFKSMPYEWSTDFGGLDHQAIDFIISRQGQPAECQRSHRVRRARSARFNIGTISIRACRTCPLLFASWPVCTCDHGAFRTTRRLWRVVRQMQVGLRRRPVLGQVQSGNLRALGIVGQAATVLPAFGRGRKRRRLHAGVLERLRHAGQDAAGHCPAAQRRRQALEAPEVRDDSSVSNHAARQHAGGLRRIYDADGVRWRGDRRCWIGQQ